MLSSASWRRPAVRFCSYLGSTGNISDLLADFGKLESVDVKRLRQLEQENGCAVVFASYRDARRIGYGSSRARELQPWACYAFVTGRAERAGTGIGNAMTNHRA